MEGPPPPYEAARQRAQPVRLSDLLASAGSSLSRAEFLFAYGTLMRGLPLHHLIEGRADFVAAGSIGGRLVDLGGYPGALPGGGTIRGEVYRLPSVDILAAVDAVEGTEFPRRLTPVRLDDGREVSAWTYWFDGPANGAVPIPDGDYRSHVTARETER